MRSTRPTLQKIECIVHNKPPAKTSAYSIPYCSGIIITFSVPSTIISMSSTFRTPTKEKRSFLMPTCPPPPSPNRRLRRVSIEPSSSSSTTMVDIGGEGDEIVGFVLIAPLGSDVNAVVQHACCSSTKEENLQVSVSSKNVLRPRPLKKLKVSPSSD